ncbi:hypothetical protein J132_02236 [Termitomyces sp. J132]|nr:hypothetical protein J132_02236 [Termitomyces sp. J132]
MCDHTQYNSTLFVQDIQNSAYQLPILVQQYLRRARALRIDLLNEAAEEHKARLRHGVQWFVASMAYVIRPRTDEQRFMVLTRVLMADDSLQALMDTVETGTFIPDDWIAMFGLLTDELSFRGYGDLVQEIFKPFVEWMESRPCVNVTTPTLAASVEPIEPPPLFLPSPAIPANANSPVKLKRTRSISPSIAEAQSSKRLKLSDGNALPSPDGGCEEVILSLKVIPATPPFVSMKAGSDTVLHVYDDPSLGPAIALTPAVWRVSSSSPLAIQTPHSSSPESPVPPSEPISVPSRTPTPPSERKHRKAVAVYSRSKFTPSKNSGSSTVSVENPVAAGKLESSSKSLISGRSQAMPKTVPEFVPSRTPVSSVKSVCVIQQICFVQKDRGF